MKHTLYHADVSTEPKGDLLSRLSKGYCERERQKIGEALELALKARDHDPLERPRGVDVAVIVHHLKVDAMTIQAALLSDPYIRDGDDGATIQKRFGGETAELVNKVNWLNTFDEYQKSENKEPTQAELLRSMLLAVVNDVRAVLIKLAYRLQRLRVLKDNPDEALKRTIALETIDLFTPLANRLGVGQLKWELEDLSFRYLEPDEYKRLAKSLAANRAERESFIQHFMMELREKLDATGIEARVFGRPKHIYSIHRKMERKDVSLDELYDLHAVRVIVQDITTCYAVLAVVHRDWLHIEKEFDDYIAHPKANGYQSLHTVVIGEEGRPVEIQIRTQDMHSFAEYGVAAHWRYKEGSKQDQALDRNVNTLRQLLEGGDEGAHRILESFRSELFEDQIFVLTPKGQVFRLRKGATPIDFAYGIHTEVGHRCRGAKVNGQMVPLTYSLKSGEKIEIITTKQGGPSLGWIDPHHGYIKTSHARNKIRAWFRQQDHERYLKAGKIIFDRERQKQGLKDIDLDLLAKHLHLPRGEDVILALGRSDITLQQLSNALKPFEQGPKASPIPVIPRKPLQIDTSNNEVLIEGVKNLLTHFARCCEPAPGDRIIGYVSLGRGIAIHRQDCTNIQKLPEEKQDRLLKVSWASEPEAFPVEIEISAEDRKGLLKDIYNVLTQTHINILRTNSVTDPVERTVLLQITAEVENMVQLNAALSKMLALHSVTDARRREAG